MAYSKDRLTTELSSIYGRYKTEAMPRWYSDRWGQSEEINRAWRLYSAANSTKLETLLLGDESIRDDKDILRNFGTTAAYPQQNPRGSTTYSSGQSASNTQGSVLKEQDWWPLPNDAWVLGGVHALVPFHLASGTLPADDVIWDSKAGRPRVLGRELLGLIAFGYKRVAHSFEGSLGIVLAPVDKQAAIDATFTKYLDAAAACKSLSAIKDAVSTGNSVAYASYTTAKV